MNQISGCMNMESKLAIITDIHGNRSALKAVLDEIDKDSQIEHIYCLGDLIGIGHETNEVLELLFSRNEISFVMGNHDEAVVNIILGNEPASVGEQREVHHWIAPRLDKKFIPYLLKMPKKLSANHSGKRFLFVHYHLDEQDKFLAIDKKPTTKKLEKCYQTFNADIVCFGHHHRIHHFKSRERLYLNPGSLGCHHKPFAPYATIKMGEAGQINVSFNEVPYDNREFLLSYKKRNVPAQDYMLKTFHGNQHLHYM